VVTYYWPTDVYACTYTNYSKPDLIKSASYTQKIDSTTFTGSTSTYTVDLSKVESSLGNLKSPEYYGRTLSISLREEKQDGGMTEIADAYCTYNNSTNEWEDSAYHTSTLNFVKDESGNYTSATVTFKFTYTNSSTYIGSRGYWKPQSSSTKLYIAIKFYDN